MSQDAGYRESHSMDGKGEQYDTYYEQNAWQAFMWRREQQCIDDLLEAELGGGKDLRLLDFACGSGRITQFLESRVASCTGVDVSEPMLERARAKLKRTKLIKADLTRENLLEGQRFDLITAFRFFTNAEDELRKNVMDVLPGYLEDSGHILFNNHHLPNAMYFRASRLLARVRGRQTLDPSMRMMSMDETLALVEGAGLRPVATRHVGFFHLPSINPPAVVMDSIESLATRFGPLARRCESIMVLCRR